MIRKLTAVVFIFAVLSHHVLAEDAWLTLPGKAGNGIAGIGKGATYCFRDWRRVLPIGREA